MPNWITSPLPIAYPQAILRMESHVADMHAGRAQEQIWLLEHPALITAGASAKAQDLLQPDRFPVFVTRRGGQYTYHGLGQRIGYVMLDLNVRGRDVRQFVWNIEEWLILTFAELGLTVQRRQGRIGLWVCGADGQEAKIAAVGLRLRKWISFHGFSVNVHPNLEHFQAIVPCGIDPKAYGVTSLVEQGIDISLEHFDGLLQQNFSKVF